MRRFWIAILLIILVACAGCAGVVNDSPESDTSTNTSSVDSENGTSTRSDTTEETETSSEDPQDNESTANGVDETDTGSGEDGSDRYVNPQNPYGSRELTVYVDDDRTDRDVSASVESAFEYWEANAVEYAGYNISYTTVENKQNADLYLKFETVRHCGLTIEDESNMEGCADLVTDEPDGRVDVRVETGLPTPVLEAVLIHELGHTLGLKHGDEPGYYMDETLPGLNGWEPLTVYVESKSGVSVSAIKDEATEALDYYSDSENTNGTEPLNYSFVDSRSDAHLTITYRSHDKNECEEGVSCWREGEYQSQYTIHIEEAANHKTVAFHVGFYLAQAVFFDGLPEELDTRQLEERKEWPPE